MVTTNRAKREGLAGPENRGILTDASKNTSADSHALKWMFLARFVSTKQYYFDAHSSYFPSMQEET
jgi:hypothetical protein